MARLHQILLLPLYRAILVYSSYAVSESAKAMHEALPTFHRCIFTITVSQLGTLPVNKHSFYKLSHESYQVPSAFMPPNSAFPQHGHSGINRYISIDKYISKWKRLWGGITIHRENLRHRHQLGVTNVPSRH